MTDLALILGSIFILAVIICNGLVIFYATRNASNRERAVEAAPNVVVLAVYRKPGGLFDEVA